MLFRVVAGRHEYKFKVDDTWMCDPQQQMTDNGQGTQNNVTIVDRRDFQVFEALERLINFKINK